ncbi:MAG: pyridoxamine 5'-phosphate oxidase, partial [Ferruginibacter sp.]
MSDIAAIRKEYSQRQLLEENAQVDAMKQFEQWWQEAVDSAIDEVNACTLATIDEHQTPCARIVLLKGIDPTGLVFFTNYESHKGQQLLRHPKACMVFFWKELERQIRVSGLVEPIMATDSDRYFQSRPLESQLGAWASQQSRPIESRHALEAQFEQTKNTYQHAEVPRPPHWGGFRLVPVSIEFWQGRPGRMHDRLL